MKLKQPKKNKVKKIKNNFKLLKKSNRTTRFFNSLKFFKVNKENLNQTKLNELKSKRLLIFKNFILVLAISVIFGGLIAGMAISGDNLKYNFKEGIELSGGYSVTAGDYDFTKDGQTLTNDPKGDISKDYKLLENKLDPLNQHAFTYKKAGDHAITVTVPKSYYSTLTDFENNVNRMGAVFPIIYTPTAGNEYKTGKDVLVNDEKTTPVTYTRTPISQVFTSSSATVDQNRLPILRLTTGKSWSDVNKIIASKPLLLWTDLGEMINQVRNDFIKYVNNGDDNFVQYMLITHRYLNTSETKGDITSEQEGNLENVFKFSYTDPEGSYQTGNFLDSGTYTTLSILRSIVNGSNFKWNISEKQLIVNPNESASSDPKVKLKNVSVNEAKYFINLEPVINSWYTANSETKKELSKYLLNYQNIKNTTDLSTIKASNTFTASKNAIDLKEDTESNATIASALLKSGFSGIVFNTIYANQVDPVISANVWLATRIIMYVSAGIFCAYLIVYFRSFGFIASFNILFSVLLTIYVSSVLSVTFGPGSIIALIIGMATMVTGLMLIIRRYKKEKIENNLPIITAFKIALKQTLPFLIDGIVIFIILALGFYWFSSGNVKIFTTVLLLSLCFSLLFGIFVTILLFFLLIKTNLFKNVPLFDVEKNPFQFQWIKRDKYLTKLSNKQKAKETDKVIITQADLDAAEKFDSSKLKKENDDDFSLWTKVDEDLNIAKQLNKKNKSKVMKRSHKFKINLKKISIFHVIKWTPLVGFILLIVGIAFFFTGTANFDQSLGTGTVFTYSSNVWNQSGSSTNERANNEIQYIKEVARGSKNGYASQKYLIDLNKYNARFNIGVVYFQNIQYDALIIDTNIKSNSNTLDMYRFLGNTTSFGEGAYASRSSQNINYEKTNPLQINSLIENAMIGLGVGLALIFVYVIFRFDWAQFISIVGSGLFAVAISFSLVSIVHLSISLDSLIVILAVWCFTIINGAFIMSKLRENRRLFNMEDYEKFFETNYHHQEQINILKLQIKKNKSKYYRQKAKLLSLDTGRSYRKIYYELKAQHKLYKKQYKTALHKFKNQPLKITESFLENPIYKAKMSKKAIIKNKKEFSKFDFEHNFLYKISNLTIKNMFVHFFILGIFSVGILTLLAIFGGGIASLYVSLIIGIISAIYSTFVIALPIWVYLEKKRALNRVKIKKYLSSKKVHIDEQLVKGLNSK